jgi:two-component system sensor histidine kinase KdpD
VVCSRLHHVDHATVALLLVLVIVQVARLWGWAEALTAAIAGAIGFEYYFLPPRGFGTASPEHWLALAAFAVTAVVTGQIAAQLDRRRIGAVRKQTEMEQLYRLVNALLENDSTESTVFQLAGHLVEIFGFDGVALCDKHSGQIVRAGARGDAVSDEALHDAANSGSLRKDADSGFSLVPIRYGGELMGSVAISGSTVSEPLLNAIAGRVGLGLARLYAMEKTTEAEVVRRSGELKSAVMDAMAHEIRNPLNSIRIAATALLTDDSEEEPDRNGSCRREMLSIIDEEVSRMDRFLDETAQLSRLEADHIELKKAPENIGQLIPGAIAEVGAVAGERVIDIRVPAALPPAECDRDLIALVLRQLLNNAFKYSPGDSPLTVSAEFTGADIVIDVVDHGPGVAEEERERIFEKYYRGRAASSGTRGTGLGLASAKAIVQAHGGRIWVTGPPSGGAAFHVSLPVAGNAHRAAGAF